MARWAAELSYPDSSKACEDVQLGAFRRRSNVIASVDVNNVELHPPLTCGVGWDWNSNLSYLQPCDDGQTWLPEAHASVCVLPQENGLQSYCTNANAIHGPKCLQLCPSLQSTLLQPVQLFRTYTGMACDVCGTPKYTPASSCWMARELTCKLTSYYARQGDHVVWAQIWRIHATTGLFGARCLTASRT
jgi:hypothetical protein